MRISDWSSDVCSSDLNSISRLSWGEYGARVGVPRILELLARRGVPASFYVPAVAALLHPEEQDRKSVVSGKSVSVRVYLGGRRRIIKIQRTYTHNIHHHVDKHRQQQAHITVL